MEIIKAILLGIIQGLTEFLPVSSSGHLEIAKFLMDDENIAEQSLMMTVVLHFATALSTMVVFRKEILILFKGLFSSNKGENEKLNENQSYILKIVISMIPAVFIGLMYEKQIEQLFNKNLLFVGISLIITGVILFLADRAKETEKMVGFVPSFLIGVSQAIAILPGISRSGATISTSVLLGIDKESAAKFSFLMVLPLIFGKIAKDILDGAFTSNVLVYAPLVAGFIAAFFTGLVACTWMIKLVKKSKLKYFGYYCIVVGEIAIGYEALF